MTMTDAQVQTACKNNPYYKQQLGDQWVGFMVSHAAVDGPEFAQDTYRYQGEIGLDQDGMWGPNTNSECAARTLTPDQIQYACKRNPYWQRELASQWAGGLVSKEMVNSPLFAEDIYQFQKEQGLTMDGICGPRTNAAAAEVPYEPPVGTEYILVNGQKLTCDFPVISPDEPGALVFTDGFYPEPLLMPTLFVLHWDGCLSSRSCFDVLCGRDLSVLFMLDKDGTTYQGVDPAKATCWHAGTVNRWAWGVEICNPVYPKYQNTAYPRPLSTMQVRGDNSKILGFYPIQVQNAVKLCHWVCNYAGIPKQLPAQMGKPADVYNSYFAPQPPTNKWDIHGFKGVAGHFHQDNNKCDPGMELWYALIESGFAVVEV
jgi:hypothetical protein